MDDPARQFVVVGKVSSAYGIKGWLKVISFTDPPKNILHYQPLYIQSRIGQSRTEPSSWSSVKMLNGREHGKFVVMQLAGINDRNMAEQYRGLEIAVTRDQLPAVNEDEFYWVDLAGLNVVNLDGLSLGTVDSVLETGANDVLVVKGTKERLIPYVMQEFIHKIDLDAGTITVDWDPDF